MIDHHVHVTRYSLPSLGLLVSTMGDGISKCGHICMQRCEMAQDLDDEQAAALSIPTPTQWLYNSRYQQSTAMCVYVCVCVSRFLGPLPTRLWVRF